jgi:lysine-specific demethylase 3
MYNAYAASDKKGTEGSTRLHMDMADAVNIMLHAKQCKNGEPGFATWDLFRAEDASKVRQFLKEEFPKDDTPFRLSDPIHSQFHYLDNSLLAKLYDKYNVYSYRIHQRPGQAVFIPAGCAHQVSTSLVNYLVI